jgi:hypothetical protein
LTFLENPSKIKLIEPKKGSPKDQAKKAFKNKTWTSALKRCRKLPRKGSKNHEGFGKQRGTPAPCKRQLSFIIKITQNTKQLFIITSDIPCICVPSANNPRPGRR